MDGSEAVCCGDPGGAVGEVSGERVRVEEEVAVVARRVEAGRAVHAGAFVLGVITEGVAGDFGPPPLRRGEDAVVDADGGGEGLAGGGPDALGAAGELAVEALDGGMAVVEAGGVGRCAEVEAQVSHLADVGSVRVQELERVRAAA